MAVLSATTGAYAYLMGPVLRFLLSGGTSGLGMVARYLPALNEIQRSQALFWVPVLIVAIGAVKGLAYLGQFFCIGWFAQRAVADLRRQILIQLSSLSPVQLSQRMSGDLLSRFSADVSAVETAATYGVASYLRDSLQIVILVGVALALNWRIALVAMLIIPVAAFPVSRLTKRLLSRIREGQTQLGQLAAQIKEGLGAVKTIQAFNAQGAEMRRFEARSAQQRLSMTRAGWIRGAIPSMMEGLAAVALAAALGFTAATRSVPPENLISLFTAMILIYQPVKELGRVNQFMLQASVSGQRIFELLDSARESSDRDGSGPAPALRSSIQLEDVWFSYGDRPALRGLSIVIPMGKVTALVGPSGAGKSTVASLLLRFDRPQRGRILFDQEDIAGASSDAVRAQFALVTQEPLLFSTTILENIRVARPSASREEVVFAAQVAQADAFVRELPNGYDAQVGERGVVLSGGQKQRLCLARAILSNAPVLVLDEPTSNLDPQSERELEQALNEVLPGRTALIIAHRLSTIARAHRIQVIDKGSAVESGSHAELLRRGGLYARLWELQQQPLPSPAGVAQGKG
jgi:subfamily B ATP-binding cassette protein MsbA